MSTRDRPRALALAASPERRHREDLRERVHGPAVTERAVGRPRDQLTEFRVGHGHFSITQATVARVPAQSKIVSPNTTSCLDDDRRAVHLCIAVTRVRAPRQVLDWLDRNGARSSRGRVAKSDDGGPRRYRVSGSLAGFERSGAGSATNRRRHGLASHRAHRADRVARALSVAMPVFAYICL